MAGKEAEAETDSLRRFQKLIALTPLCTKVGDSVRGRQYVADAQSAYESIDWTTVGSNAEWERCGSSISLAETWFLIGERARAESALEGAKVATFDMTGSDRSLELPNLLQAQIKMGDLPAARRTAEQMQSINQRGAYEDIAKADAAAGDWDAFRSDNAKAGTGLGYWSEETGLREMAKTSGVADAQKFAAEHGWNNPDNVQLQILIGRLLAGDADAAWTIAQSIINPSDKTESFYRIAIFRGQHEDANAAYAAVLAARKACELIENPHERAIFLLKLSIVASKLQHIDLAKAMIDEAPEFPGTRLSLGSYNRKSWMVGG